MIAPIESSEAQEEPLTQVGSQDRVACTPRSMRPQAVYPDSDAGAQRGHERVSRERCSTATWSGV